MKQFWLHSLLRIYSLVMIVVIASFAIMLSYADWDSREKEAQRVAERVTTRTVRKWNTITESQPDLLSLWLKIRPH